MIEPTYRRAGKDYDALEQQQWKQFSDEYSKQYPNHRREDKKLSHLDIAKAANIQPYYDSYYRLYCQVTHVAFRAMTGGLQFSDSEDNRTMALCVLGALDALDRSKISNISGLTDLRRRLSDLPGSTP